MRAVAVLSLIAAAAFGGAARARPLRIMSLNECTDQIALQLLPPERITSVTWLSRDPSISMMTAAAGRVGVNHGKAEEVIRDRPDLVLASTYAAPAERALLKRLHYPVLEIGPIDSFDDIRRVTRKIAVAVGAQARGEVLLGKMDAALKALAADPAPPIRVVAWDGAGFSAQKGSLYDAILTVAGAVNAAPNARRGAGSPGVEDLLAAAPALLVRGGPGDERPGRRTDTAFHPLIRRFWKDRTVIVPQSLYTCGTSLAAEGALRLRDTLRAKAAMARAPLGFQRTTGP